MPESPPARYARHSRLSDPGEQADFLARFPSEPAELGRVIRNLTAHYRATPGIPEARLTEADTRWMSAILRRLRDASDAPLGEPRPLEARFVGCCRDDALLFVAAMREHGVPARSRVGFAPYFSPAFFHDHVIAEYWNGARWVRLDPELEPSRYDFDTQDLPPEAFLTAAQVWQGIRAGGLDPTRFGVFPDAPDFLRGEGFIRRNLLLELAALNGMEVLLWDSWGLMDTPAEALTKDDLALLDEVAAALIADDDAALTRLSQDPRLTVPPVLRSWPRSGGEVEVRL